MAPSLQEQLGVASNAIYWDVGRFRLWQSTVPEVILYVARDMGLAKEDSGRYRAAFTEVRRWSGGSYEVMGGSAILGVFGDLSIEEEGTRELEEQWARVVLNMGYKGAMRPRFLPLPVRDVRLMAIIDASQVCVAEPPGSAGESRTLMFDLSTAAARAWERAILEKSTVPGGVRLFYVYPQMMPQATATVTIHGLRVYASLTAMLNKADDGTLYGSSDDIRSAWSSLVRGGAIEISLTGSPPVDSTNSRADLLDRLSEQAREQLFDLLFTPYVSKTSGAGSFYALRWRTLVDVTDLGMTITVEGWTWLSASLDAEISALLGALDESYVHTSYESVSVPVALVVDPSQMVTNVAASLDFGDVHSPEAPVFDATGGTRQFLISTGRPETVSVSYRTKVNFKPSNWPVVEISGTATLTADGYRIVVRPESWIRRHTLYMYVRRGSRIIPQVEADPADYLTVTATYVASYLALPIRAASRITPQGPVQFSYPIPPEAQAGRATLSVIGMVGGQLVRASELEVQEKEDAVYLLVDGSRIQLVGRNAVISESDPLADRLRSANARPVVSHGIAPSAEETRDLDVNADVALIPQPTDVSCWAASLAMVVSARDSASTPPQTVASRAGMDVDTGYGWTDIQRAVVAWNLVEEGPRSAMPEEWARLLELWGPIWVVEVGAPYHAVVLGGVRGDGTPDGTYVTVYNPWPPGVGVVDTKTFLEFDQEFGLGAGAGAAMVHAIR